VLGSGEVKHLRKSPATLQQNSITKRESTSTLAQRILSPMIAVLPNLTKRYKPGFTRLAVVKVSLRLAWYQHVPPPS